MGLRVLESTIEPVLPLAVHLPRVENVLDTANTDLVEGTLKLLGHVDG